jgi:hypothetical protein
MSGLSIHHKRNYHVVRWTIALVLLAGLAAYAYFGIRWYSTGELSPLPMPVAAADTSIDESAVTEKQIQDHQARANEPRYIEIPRLNISGARVSNVGLTDRNMLDMPKHLDDAGWYAKSAAPGSGVGAVVLNGHSDGYSRDGLFAGLSKLEKGDQISLERGDGKSFTYEVYDVRDMDIRWVNASGMQEMMRSAEPDKEGLSLIANAGKWVPKDKVFDRRVLVRATIVE